MFCLTWLLNEYTTVFPKYYFLWQQFFLMLALWLCSVSLWLFTSAGRISGSINWMIRSWEQEGQGTNDEHEIDNEEESKTKTKTSINLMYKRRIVNNSVSICLIVCRSRLPVHHSPNISPASDDITVTWILMKKRITKRTPLLKK